MGKGGRRQTSARTGGVFMGGVPVDWSRHLTPWLLLLPGGFMSKLAVHNELAAREYTHRTELAGLTRGEA